MALDQHYMARALQLAERGRYSTQPNPRVGCVIVKQGVIVGEGFHHRAGENHAEMNALEQAGDNAKGADVFVTLEPCSHQGRTAPCADALVRAHVKRVVIAMQDPNPLVSGEGFRILQDANIEVSSGVGEIDAERLNRGYIKRMRDARPYVTLKIAASLDGRIAMQSGESAWITSASARTDVHRMRLQSCAVMTGINTVLADNPRLTARLEGGDIDSKYHLTERQPIRIVLDSQNRLLKHAAILSQPGVSWQFVDEALTAEIELFADHVFPIGLKHGKLDLHAVLEVLGTKEINQLMVEAGGALAASFIQAGLVDELVVYQSPDIMGSNAQAMINLDQILKMSQKIEFEYQDVRKIGRDLKLVLTPKQKQ